MTTSLETDHPEPIKSLVSLNMYEGWAKRAEQFAARGDIARSVQCAGVFEEIFGIPISDRHLFRDRLMNQLEQDKPNVAAAFREAESLHV